MKAFILLLALVATSITTCSDPASPFDDEPAWVRQMIRDFEAAPVGNPPQSIWKYRYNGMTYYYVPPQCCDQYSDLYNFFGDIVCHPDGGITGRGDGKCPEDFRDKAKMKELVWQDPRQR